MQFSSVKQRYVYQLPTTNTYRHNKINKLLNCNFHGHDTTPLRKTNHYINEESTNIVKQKTILLISGTPTTLHDYNALHFYILYIILNFH